MPSALLLFPMAALDTINDRKIKKLKYPDMVWRTVQTGASGSLHMGPTAESLQEQSGSIDWTQSRYLRVGREMHYYAYIGGQYYVLLDRMRLGYVEPKHVSIAPIYDEEEDE